jgi:hypothetical protein
MTTTDTTSIKVEFYGSASSSNLVVSANLMDKRTHLSLNLSSNEPAKLVSATLFIDKHESTTSGLKSHALKLGQNNIGSPSTVSSTDIVHHFLDNEHYSLKIKVLVKDGSEIAPLYAKFSYGKHTNTQNLTSYNYMHRTSVDAFDTSVDQNGNPALRCLNLDEIQPGSNIMLSCPIVFTRVNDTRRPHSLLVSFDEVDDYASPNNSDNSEQLSSYSVLAEYQSSGQYTLSNNQLLADSAYRVNIVALYSEGHSVSTTLPGILQSIVSPVISYVTAYGLGDDKFGSGVSSTLSTLMEVFISDFSSPVKLALASDSVTFELTQGQNTFYKATLPLSTTVLNGVIKYTIDNVKDENGVSLLEKVGGTPTQENDGTYKFNVTAKMDYESLNPDAPNIVKMSNAVEGNFNSDINQLPPFTISNAWIAAAVTTSGNVRQVNLSDPESATGYQVAPEFGIVGKMSKNAFYGSSIPSGLYADLDKVTTKHKFMMKVESDPNAVPSFVPVTKLYQMLGDSSKNDQQNYIDLLSMVGQPESNANGLFPNIPGQPGVSGSDQPSIYFHIPHSPGLFSNEDSVVVSIQIIGPNSSMTRPDPTYSDEQVVIHKVKRYEMVEKTDSEPTFSGTGASGVLKVPINNTPSENGDFYLYSATFTSNLDSPNATSTVLLDELEENGFDIIITDPSARGVTEYCTYKVYYTVTDPNNSKNINGPLSEQYSLRLTDDPTSDNILVTNYSYKTYNKDSESGFKFDLEFVDVGDTSADGVKIYFESDTIPKTLVKKVSRYDANGVKLDVQHNISVVLQDTAVPSELVDGIEVRGFPYIPPIIGSPSPNKWLNFADGIIRFVPYSTKKTNSHDVGPETESSDSVNKHINHIPTIPVVEGARLTGGMKDSNGPTKISWNNELVSRYGALSTVEASYNLTLNSVDVNENDSAVDSYVVDISGPVATYTFVAKVKITTMNDGEEYFSEPITLTFVSDSIDQSAITIDFERGSNDAFLNAKYSFNGSPNNISDLENNVSARLVDTSRSSNLRDPVDAGVRLLDGMGMQCTPYEYPPYRRCDYWFMSAPPHHSSWDPEASEIQRENDVNTYNIPSSEYPLGHEMRVAVRFSASVPYTLSDVTGTRNSEPMYLNLPLVQKPYIVANRPRLTIASQYRIVPGTNDGTTSDYSGRIAVDMCMNANGLKTEGIQSLVFVIGQESNYTDSNDSGGGEGRQVLLSFSSSEATVPTYDKQEAATTLNTLDNISAGETLTLTVDNVAGFNEGAGLNWTFVAGDLTSNDQSTLYFPVNSGFDKVKELSFVGVIATRVGIAFSAKLITY